MTASEIFHARTGTENENYIEMAEQAVREYLNYGEGDSLEAYVYSIGEIDVLLYQRDMAVAAMSTQTAGVKSESFAEGAVSVRSDYLTPADMATSYDSKVQTVLNSLSRHRIARVPEVTSADA